MLDLLICNVPGTISVTPSAAPAILKAVTVSHGYSAKTIDFNARFYHETKSSIDFEPLTSYFTDRLTNSDIHTKACVLIKNWIDEITDYSPRYIGISVFTYQCRRATELFCAEIRKQLPQTKIILGGQGILDGGINGSRKWIDKLQSLNLFDFWVKSEGEKSLVKILKNQEALGGVNEFDLSQVEDLDSIPLPDYSDYDFNLYEDKILPITGSRGCVRSCSFCDIHTHWKKFTFRTGETIADEMIKQSQKYGITKFRFTDSLVNGNLKQYKQFIKILAEYNSHTDSPIKWTGQFIIRQKSTSDDEMWRLTALSGAYNLAIGIESGSESVRQHIGKEFTNNDIDHAMECMDNYDITCIFLMLVGYPTETEKDFQDSVEMFKRYQHYANKVITNVELGSTLGILPNTPLADNAQELGIKLDARHENFWTNINNPSLTFKERLRRRFTIRQLLVDLGYNLREDNHQTMLHYLWEYYKGTTNQQSQPIIMIKNAESFSGS
jgi:hypothetical protein